MAGFCFIYILYCCPIFFFSERYGRTVSQMTIAII